MADTVIEQLLDITLPTPDEIISRIEYCKKNHTDILDLSNAFLHRLPQIELKEIASQIKTLDLSGNRLSPNDGDWIAANLSNLQTLRLFRNNTHVNIGINQLLDITNKLTNLRCLDIGSNNLGSRNAKKIIENLTGITHLNISNNDLDDDVILYAGKS